MNPKHQLTPQQQAWYDKACACVDKERLRQLNLDLVNIHSPTGAEKEASEFMSQYMAGMGLNAKYQPVNDLSGNAVGELNGSGEGATMLLYAPIDTHLEGSDEDLPMVGDELRDDMRPQGYLRDDLV
ncbi:MAG: acetylornithine deacetylase, partial [Oceanospirillaceae bacterium]|nr:acetylornithine deacetylase [Oceanospirillaceae bacterium]